MASLRTPPGPGRFLVGAALACGLLALVTGAAALLDYPLQPSADAVAPGAFVDPATRAMHGAAGNLLVVAFALGWVWACLRADGARARRPVAVASAVALASTLVAFWTGRVLTGDQHGWESWWHFTAALDTLRGHDVVAPAPQQMPRRALFVVHALASAAAPLAFVAALVRARDTGGVGVVLRGLLGDATVRSGALAAASLAFLLAVVAPPLLGPYPVIDLAVSRPDWPFLWVAGCERVVGAWGPVVGGAGFVTGLLGAAIVERRRFRLALLWGLGALLAVLSAVGARG